MCTAWAMAVSLYNSVVKITSYAMQFSPRLQLPGTRVREKKKIIVPRGVTTGTVWVEGKECGQVQDQHYRTQMAVAHICPQYFWETLGTSVSFTMHEYVWRNPEQTFPSCRYGYDTHYRIWQFRTLSEKQHGYRVLHAPVTEEQKHY